MERIHPELASVGVAGNQGGAVNRTELERRCAQFREEVATQAKKEHREKFEERVLNERKRKKEEAEAARHQQPRIEWPETMDISGYHPVPGNVQEMADQDAGQCSHETRQNEDTDITEEMIAAGNDLGATPHYEILEPTLADIFAEDPVTTDTSNAGISVNLDLSTQEDPWDQKTGPKPAEEVTAATPKSSENISADSAGQESPVRGPLLTDAATQVGLAPCGEGLEEARPLRLYHIPAGAPTYRLTPAIIPTEPEGAAYDQWYRDPLLFFVAAPSTYKDIYPSRILKEARRQALYEPQRRVARVIPQHTDYIERIESVELSDGRIYRLQARWFENKVMRDLVSTGTQCRITEE